MVNDDLVNLEKQYKNNLYNTYMENKNLFIYAEELLEPMSFFVAPVLEHRDALDHIMRYFDLKNKDGLSEVAVKELDRALAHELRAYFDIADYVCITVRQQISDSLKRVSIRKINKVWDEYSNIKKRIVNVSEEIAGIRQSRNGSLKHIEKYKPVMDEMLDIYRTYVINIEPQIKRNFSWKKGCARK